jgi:nitroreductase
VTGEQLLRSRRAIRRYQRRDVPDDLIEAILDTARYAPSSMNGQPWCFVVVRQVETKRELARMKNMYCPLDKRTYPADFLAEAPVIVAICVERWRSHRRERENGVLAAAYVMFAACERGLGSVFLTAYQPDEPALAEEIARLLGLPDGIEPVALVPLGFAAEVPPPKELRALADVVHHERFGQKRSPRGAA